MGMKLVIRYGFLVAVLLFAGIAMQVTCRHAGAGPIDPVIAKAMITVMEQKVFAEDAALAASERFKNDPDKLLEVQRQYSVARSKDEGFIAMYKLTLNSASFDRDAFESKAEELVLAGNNLGDMVYGPQRAALPIADLIEGIVSGAIKVWEAFKNYNRERKKDIMDLLDTYKFKTWSEVVKPK